MENQTNDFLPEQYDVPKGSNYLKLKDGENRFRIMSKPIIGWQDWKDKKPIRFRMSEKPKSSIDPKKPIKHFWAFVVFDYADKAVKILELTQKTIQEAIQNYSRDEEWGSPLNYDLKITRRGSGMETEYSTIASPAKPASEEIKQAYFEKGSINLDALYEGGDPFEQTTSVQNENVPF